MGGIEGAVRSELLLKLARQVTSRHDLEDVLDEVFKCLRPLVAFGGGSIQLLDDDGWIQMVAADPVPNPLVLAQRIPLGSSVAGRVILTEAPMYLPDVADYLGNKDQGARTSSDVCSYFGVPLMADGRAIGVLQVDSPNLDAWTMDERAIVLSAALSVSAAIQNASANARIAEMKMSVDEVEQRLAAVNSLVEAARGALHNGDRAELERQLTRINAVLSGDLSPSKMLRLPQQRDLEVGEKRQHRVS